MASGTVVQILECSSISVIGTRFWQFMQFMLVISSSSRMESIHLLSLEVVDGRGLLLFTGLLSCNGWRLGIGRVMYLSGLFGDTSFLAILKLFGLNCILLRFISVFLNFFFLYLFFHNIKD